MKFRSRCSEAHKTVLVAVATVILAGCSPLEYMRETSSVDTTAAFQLTNRDVVEPIDLERLLVRYAPGNQAAMASCRKLANFRAVTGADAAASPEDARLELEQERLDRALAYFNCQMAASTELSPTPCVPRIAERSGEACLGQREQIRNSLQERMLASSQQRCAAFKSNLQRTFSRTNFGLGVLTTVAGTAGALVHSAAAASNLAGAAAIFSGTRAEFNQDFMANLAAHVIIDGIDKRREAVYRQIMESGQSKPYAAYPVEAAIKDAIYFHGECSVVAGFQEASDAIKYANDPGLSVALDNYFRIRAANELGKKGEFLGDGAKNSVEEIVRRTPTVVGTVLKQQQAPQDFFLVSARALARIDEATVRLSTQVETMRKEMKDIKLVTEKLKEVFGSSGAPADFDKVKTTCKAKTASLLVEVQTRLAQSSVESDAAKQATLGVGAATSMTSGRFLADKILSLADLYEASVSGRVAQWQDATKSVQKGEKGAVEKLVTGIGKVEFDTTLKNAVLALCQ